jgi:toxin ParE1/3/4
MKLKPVEHHPGARLDVIEAFEWYELREADLGVRFQGELAAAEKFVQRNPLLGQPFKFGTRKWPLKVFPYTLIYSIELDLILVLAVAHYSRVSDYWHYRLTH